MRAFSFAPRVIFGAKALATALLLTAACAAGEASDKSPAPAADAKPAASVKDEKGWKNLFDGKSLTGWTKSEFAGGNDVEVEDGAILINAGERLSGVTWSGDALPTNNYEIALEAKRVSGVDFFCGVTFPVRDKFLSLIVGGWGGSVVGISNINDNAAADNETTRVIGFKSKKWYAFKIRVTDEKVEAWIDDEQVVDLETKGKKLSIREEIGASKPFGISTFQTTAAMRNIRVRELKPEDLKKEQAEEKK